MSASQGSGADKDAVSPEFGKESKDIQNEIPANEPAKGDEKNPPCSAFTPAEKKSITFLASLSAIFSTISSFIYYPAITAISRSLHVSIGAINLTVTSYFVVAGIAPSIMGDMADQTGRRPVSLLAFTLYLSANLGLAAQKSYAALQFLRCLQSAGASGTVAITYGGEDGGK